MQCTNCKIVSQIQCKSLDCPIYFERLKLENSFKYFNEQFSYFETDF